MTRSARNWRVFERIWRFRVLLLLSLIYVVLGLAYVGVTPILEKSDEQGHYGYLLYLRENRALPPLQVIDELSFEFKQPPLYYVVASVLSRLLPDSPSTSAISLDRNPYVDHAVPGERGDNRTVYLHPPHHTPLGTMGRVVSMGFGWGTMVMAYFLAREVMPTVSPAHYASAMIAGFQPRFMYMATAVNNDASAAFFGATITYLLVQCVRRGARLPLLGLMGSVLGLAALSKTSSLLFLPLACLVLVAAPDKPWQRRVVDPAVIVVIAVVVGGWWYVRNAVAFGDVITLGSHLDSDLGIRPLSDRLVRDVLSIEYTFWANLARTTVARLPLDSVLIWWGRLSSIALIVGVWRWRSGSPSPDEQSMVIILLCVPVAFVLALVGYWTRTQAFAFGRLLLPALAALVTLWVFGWSRALADPWRGLLLRLSGGLVLCTSVITPFVSIWPLYHPHRRFDPESAQALVDWHYYARDGSEIARLIGYNAGSSYVTEEASVALELCWLPVGRTDAPASVFVHIVDASQVHSPTGPPILGGRRTYPGLGNKPTDRWALLESFCDPLWVRLSSAEAVVPTQTLVEVGLIDGTSGERLEVRDGSGSPITAMLPGPALVNAADLESEILVAQYVFGESIVLHRLDAELDGRSLEMEMTWQSRHHVPYDAVVFVHVLDSDGALVAQTDIPPAGDRFHTSAWIPRQILTGTLVLPLPAGHSEPYALRFGLYERESLQRLPVVGSDGELAVDSMIVCHIGDHEGFSCN